MDDRDWRIMREDFDILVKGGRAVNPLRKWDECPMHPLLRRAIDDMGYTAPTPIQRQAIPMGLAGRDLIGVAETGSGKTAAFLIPLLTYVLSQPLEVRERVAEQGPLALVMAPTRELAQQIEDECTKLAKHAAVRSAAVVGGVNIAEQSLKLRSGVDVVIGTPGRLIESVESRYLVLHQCRYVVLDEADKMIDLGFEPQVTQVFEEMGRGDATTAVGGALVGGVGAGAMSAPPPDDDDDDDDMRRPTAPAPRPPPPPPPPPAAAAGATASSSRGGVGGGVAPSGRTTHMFSATFPPVVQKLARTYMHQPATVQIGDQDSGKNKRIAQEVIFLPSEAKKRSKLVEVLHRSPRPAIIFINAKKQCDIIGRDLEEKGFLCVVLHGGKAQEEREDALAEFKSGAYDILIATDVAGRGLDIPDVAQVINYDMPPEIDRYTHRIGRTGRAGKAGKAVTFFTDDDSAVLPALKQYLESTGQQVPPELAQRATGTEGKRDKIQYAKK